MLISSRKAKDIRSRTGAQNSKKPYMYVAARASHQLLELINMFERWIYLTCARPNGRNRYKREKAGSQRARHTLVNWDALFGTIAETWYHAKFQPCFKSSAPAQILDEGHMHQPKHAVIMLCQRLGRTNICGWPHLAGYQFSHH